MSNIDFEIVHATPEDGHPIVDFLNKVCKNDSKQI